MIAAIGVVVGVEVEDDLRRRGGRPTRRIHKLFVENGWIGKCVARAEEPWL
jgi:hypothetical protein